MKNLHSRKCIRNSSLRMKEEANNNDFFELQATNDTDI